MSGANCIQEIQLSAYLDGELSANDMAQVEEHLADCRNCRNAYERMKTGCDAILECMPDVTPPEYVKQRLFRKIDAVAEIRRPAGIRDWIGLRHIFSLRPKAWIAACASIVFFAIALSIFQYQRRLEDNKILAEIDHSKSEWVARGSLKNPFDIASDRASLRNSKENPFQSYLNEH
jgi:predicted anti-sigma-YlaC factor YlaD